MIFIIYILLDKIRVKIIYIKINLQNNLGKNLYINL